MPFRFSVGEKILHLFSPVTRLASLHIYVEESNARSTESVFYVQVT